jgi:hypothetical protein
MTGSKCKEYENDYAEYHKLFVGRNFATEEAAPPGAEVVLVEKLEPLHIMTVGINRSQFRTLLPKLSSFLSYIQNLAVSYLLPKT